MSQKISICYQMELIEKLDKEIWKRFSRYKKVLAYIQKWKHNPEACFFEIKFKQGGENIDLESTLHDINGETLVRMAIDMGIETPGFIPCVPYFKKNLSDCSYRSALQTFEKAIENVKSNPDESVAHANSALESIIKHILEDKRIEIIYNDRKGLHVLTNKILEALALSPSRQANEKIRNIASSLLTINQSIERLRSENTRVGHGRTDKDFILDDPLCAYLAVNSAATVGLFLLQYYKKKFPEEQNEEVPTENLPF